jgi:uncharacterized HAD superfamily protein
MNKLLLNNNARNHIKFLPLNNSVEIPETEKERILWCESRFNELSNADNIIRHFTYKNGKKGYSIGVWEYNGLYYLIQCIKNEFGTYNDVIYIEKNKDDLIAIAKFLQKNIITIMSDYKEQILEAKEYVNGKKRIPERA